MVDDDLLDGSDRTVDNNYNHSLNNQRVYIHYPNVHQREGILLLFQS
jgi:hypothetical protein